MQNRYWLTVMSLLAVIWQSILIAAPAVQETGELRFKDAYWDSIGGSYPPGTDFVFLQLNDPDANDYSTASDSVIIMIECESGDMESIFLYETSINSGIFRGALPLVLETSKFLSHLKHKYPEGFPREDSDGTLIAEKLSEYEGMTRVKNLAIGDGALQVSAGSSVIATYHDALNDWGVEEDVSVQVIYGGWEGYVSGTWNAENSPYVVVGDVIVGYGYSLTLAPGTRVEFMQDASLRIDQGATLQISGALDDSVYLVSKVDNPADSEFWGGVILGFYASSPLNVDISYAVVEHARLGLDLSGGSPTISDSRVSYCGDNDSYYSNRAVFVNGPYQISDCVIENNYGDGLLIGSDQGSIIGGAIRNNYGNGIVVNGGPAVITGVSVLKNGGNGILIQTYGPTNQPTIHQCELFDNSEFDVMTNASNDVDARFNWWGDATTAEINTGPNPKNLSRISDYFDYSYRGKIKYGGCVSCPPAGSSGILSFADSFGNDLSSSYAPLTDSAFVKLNDDDLNVNPAVSESVTVSITTDSGDDEFLVLYERDSNNSEFRGSIAFDLLVTKLVKGIHENYTEGPSSDSEFQRAVDEQLTLQNESTNSMRADNDGALQISPGEKIIVEYVDALNEWGSPEAIQDVVLYGGWAGYVSGVWPKSNNPYVVVGDIRIGPGYSLTIEAGAVIKFMPFASLLVSESATLRVLGNQTDSVVFAAYYSSPADSQIWGGIQTTGSSYRPSKMEISHAVVTYGRSGIRATGGGGTFKLQHSRVANCGSNYYYGGEQGVYANSPLEISDCILTNNLGDGLVVSGASGTVKDCEMSFNSNAGIQIQDSKIAFERVSAIKNLQDGVRFSYSYNDADLPTFHHCHLYDNTLWDFYNGSNLDIDAKYNWWGEATTIEMRNGSNPKNITKIYDEFDNSYSGIVKYGGWMNFPYVKGDINGDYQLDISDVVGLISYLYAGGAVPDPIEAGDCNCDGRINLTDIVFTINYVFAGGPEPGSTCP